jgi:hypothetical protein
MAVTFDNNIIRITAGAAQSIVTGNLAAGGMDQLRVRKLRWVSPGAGAGDNCQIFDDAAGDIIWESVADAANFVDDSDFDNGFDLRANDLTGLTATVDSGVLYIYLGGHAASV